MKVLVHDNAFPCRFGRWRLNLMSALAEKYDADFLSLTLGGANFKAQMQHSYDGASKNENNTPDCMQETSKHVDVWNYNYFIFNPAYLPFDSFNHDVPDSNATPEEEFNGKLWLGMVPGSMLMRSKKNHYELTPPNVGWINEYDLVLHTFYSSYGSFNDAFRGYPPEKQALLLYPGGGFIDRECLSIIHEDVKIICTQDFTSRALENTKMKNPTADIYPGPVRKIREKPRPKPKKTGKLMACFPHMGHNSEKGSADFYRIRDAYSKKYGNDAVEFTAVAMNAKTMRSDRPRGITWMEPMDCSTFDEFLYRRVDIIFDLQNQPPPYYGWPHGLEGVIQGAVLFTNDPLNLNKENGFNFSEGVYRITDINGWGQVLGSTGGKPFLAESAVDKVVEQIHALDSDRDLLLRQSRKAQEKAFDILSDENIYQKLFDFLEE